MQTLSWNDVLEFVFPWKKKIRILKKALIECIHVVDYLAGEVETAEIYLEPVHKVLNELDEGLLEGKR